MTIEKSLVDHYLTYKNGTVIWRGQCSLGTCSLQFLPLIRDSIRYNMEPVNEYLIASGWDIPASGSVERRQRGTGSWHIPAEKGLVILKRHLSYFGVSCLFLPLPLSPRTLELYSSPARRAVHRPCLRWLHRDASQTPRLPATPIAFNGSLCFALLRIENSTVVLHSSAVVPTKLHHTKPVRRGPSNSYYCFNSIEPRLNLWGFWRF